MRHVAALVPPALLAALPVPVAAQPRCFDIGAAQPRVLSGRLEHRVYPGAPNFADVRRGDAPEPSYVLVLPRPICLRGDELVDPTMRFSRVQIVVADALAPSFRRLLGRQVRIGLRDPMGAHTGHHHEPLVAWATTIRPAAATRSVDPADGQGTAAAAIRAFYAALHDGQGQAATALIVPEKRALPAFRAAALTRFYGGLASPIRLTATTRVGDGAYVVRYRYATRTRTCDGRAAIAMTARGGRNYIAGIRALDGC